MKTQPVIFQAKVRALSQKGYGVVDLPDGRVGFARGCWIGDEGEFKAESEKNYDYVELIKLTRPAPERREVRCPHREGNPELQQTGRCGGCPWMMIPYEKQLQEKFKRVLYALSKTHIPYKEKVLKNIIAAPDEWAYRNRAQFKTEGKILGYVSEGSRVIAPIRECMILNEGMQNRLQSLLSQLPNPEWIPADGFEWNYLDIDDATNLSHLKINRRRPFQQGNHAQNIVMKNWLKENLARFPKDWAVLEAFCGSGNLTSVMSEAGYTHILAAEVRGQAIEELRLKNLPQVKVVEIDMNTKGIWAQLTKHQHHSKILVVDPPREGIEKRKTLFKYLDKLEVMIYISCEPTTWARDVKDFIHEGFELTEIQPIDFFPQTPHVEILSILEKKR